jgi:putative oxidoreductase
MAYAYFTVHQPVALFPIPNGGEPAALYAWIFLLIGILGPGAFALDALRKRR